MSFWYFAVFIFAFFIFFYVLGWRVGRIPLNKKYHGPFAGALKAESPKSKNTNKKNKMYFGHKTIKNQRKSILRILSKEERFSAEFGYTISLVDSWHIWEVFEDIVFQILSILLLFLTFLGLWGYGPARAV